MKNKEKDGHLVAVVCPTSRLERRRCRVHTMFVRSLWKLQLL